MILTNIINMNFVSGKISCISIGFRNIVNTFDFGIPNPIISLIDICPTNTLYFLLFISYIKSGLNFALLLFSADLGLV